MAEKLNFFSGQNLQKYCSLSTVHDSFGLASTKGNLGLVEIEADAGAVVGKGDVIGGDTAGRMDGTGVGSIGLLVEILCK